MRMDRDCKYSNKIEERNLKIRVSPSCLWQSPKKLRFLIPSAGVVSLLQLHNRFDFDSF